MEQLAQLPILNQEGPAFLNVFGAIALCVVGVGLLALYLADRTRSTHSLTPAAEPDPVEIAYLAGGVSGVIRLIVYDLYQHGFAFFDGDERIGPGHRTPAAGELDAIRSRVLAAVAANPKAGDILEDAELRHDVEALCAPAQTQLRGFGLLRPHSVLTVRKWVIGSGAAILFGLAGAKTVIALSRGDTSIVLVALVLAIFAVAALAAVASSVSARHSSRLGRDYLEKMKTTHARQLAAAADRARDYHAAPSGALAFEGAALGLVGLYGFDALKGTPDAAFAAAFNASNADSGAEACEFDDSTSV